MANARSRPRRRWFQFRLRTLLGLMLLIVLLLGAWRLFVEPYQRQRQTLALVEELGGRCQTSDTAASRLSRLLRWDDEDILFIDLAECDEPDKYIGAVSRLPLLETLVVGGEYFSDEHLRKLQRLSTLRGLVLDSTGVTDEGLERFQKAKPKVDVYRSQRRAARSLGENMFVVRGEQLSDAHPALRELAGHDYFKEVTWLRFHDRAWREFGAPAVTHTLPPVHALTCIRTLRELELDCSSLMDEDLQRLTVLTSLRMLSVGETRITDAGLKHLSAFARLEELWLHGTSVTDEGLVHLSRLPRLRFLFLPNTKISDEGLKQLGKMARLERLWLYGTQVSDEGLKHLRGLSNLRELTLHGTKVTLGAVEEFEQALSNCTVHGLHPR